MEIPKAGFGLREILSILATITQLECTGPAVFATQGTRGSPPA
jgi:hypothetical protein